MKLHVKNFLFPRFFKQVINESVRVVFPVVRLPSGKSPKPEIGERGYPEEEERSERKEDEKEQYDEIHSEYDPSLFGVEGEKL